MIPTKYLGNVSRPQQRSPQMVQKYEQGAQKSELFVRQLNAGKSRFLSQKISRTGQITSSIDMFEGFA